MASYGWDRRGHRNDTNDTHTNDHRTCNSK